MYLCLSEPCLRRNTSVIGLGQESPLHRQHTQMRPLSASASSVFSIVVTSNLLFSPSCFIRVCSFTGHPHSGSFVNTQTSKDICKLALSPPPVTEWHEWVRQWCQRERTTVSHLISRLHENLFVLDRVCNNKPASLREFRAKQNRPKPRCKSTWREGKGCGSVVETQWQRQQDATGSTKSKF